MKPVCCALLAMPLAAAPALAAQHWNVDTTKSRLGFSVNWNGEAFTAAFRSWKADIDFDPADLRHSRALITIDLRSESSDDPESDDGIKGAEGFGVSQFPTAAFRANRFVKNANGYVANGTLTIKGITRPVVLPFTLTLSGNMAHMVGHAQVIRTDFRVGTGEWEKPDPVAHAVTVNVDLWATKGP